MVSIISCVSLELENSCKCLPLQPRKNIFCDLCEPFIYFGLLIFDYVHLANSLLYNVVEMLLYAPIRPVVDSAVVFLWIMAVGTVVLASLWSEYIALEKNDERYNELSPKVSFPPFVILDVHI